MSITEIYDLDFISIKENFKNFISTHEKFKDYNFEGSALSSLIDIFAYFVQHQNFYLNMVSNELFLSTAMIENNVYKLANMLNYLPNRKSAPYMTVDINRTISETVFIPKFTKFKMGDINLTNLDDIILSDDLVHTITLYEGLFTTDEFISDGTNFQTYTLTEREKIDNDNLYIYVDIPDGAGGYILGNESWKNINILDYDANGNNYYIDYFEKFYIKFDNGKLFKKPNESDRIRAVYLITNGSLYNGLVSDVVVNDTVIDATSINLANPTVLVDGTDEETIVEIKTRAPQYFSTQSRAVVEKDYEFIVKKYSKFNTFKDIIIWGGEKEFIDDTGAIVESDITKDLGHVYVSALKTDGSYLTDTNKTDVLNFLYKRKFHSIFFRYLEPNIVLLTPNIKIKYKSVLDLNNENFQQSIDIYLKTITGFNKEYKHSNFEAYVNNLNNVDYVDLTYTISVKVKNEPYKVIRLNNKIKTRSLTGFINGYSLLTDGSNNLQYNGATIGTINHNTGFIVIEYDFGVDYELSFVFDDIQYFKLEKESMLDFNDALITSIN